MTHTDTKYVTEKIPREMAHPTLLYSPSFNYHTQIMTELEF